MAQDERILTGTMPSNQDEDADVTMPRLGNRPWENVSTRPYDS